MSETQRPQGPQKRQEPDHWAELASKLGAAAPEPESPDSAGDEALPAESSQQADSGHGAAAPGAAEQRAEVFEHRGRAREPRPPTDWDLLAEELGIVAPVRAERAELPGGSEPALAPAGEPAEPVPGTEPTLAPPGAVLAQDEAELAAARFEQAVDLFDDVVESELAASASAPSAWPSSDERGSGVAVPSSLDVQGASTEAAAAEESPLELELPSFGPQEPVQTVSSAPDVATDAGRERPATAEEVPAAASIAEAAPGKRGKRRRRRPGRKKKALTSEALQGEPQEEEKAAAIAEAFEAGKAPAQGGLGPGVGQAADAEAAPQAAAKAETVAHRGIPTWEQAVGLIIGKNMEARPKARHANAPQRGHNGGRGSGRRKG